MALTWSKSWLGVWIDGKVGTPIPATKLRNQGQKGSPFLRNDAVFWGGEEGNFHLHHPPQKMPLEFRFIRAKHFSRYMGLIPTFSVEFLPQRIQVLGMNLKELAD